MKRLFFPVFAAAVMIMAACDKDVVVTGVSLDQSTLTLTEGGTATLKATVAPEDATNKEVTWASDKPAVATVSGGVVIAVAAGTAKITVTTVDGSKTASCNVTVNAPLSDEKRITDFYFASLPAAVIETDHIALTISVAAPAGTVVMSLAPTIVVSAGASVIPASGAAQNFTNPVKYTVTAADGSKAEYMVTVTAATPQPVELTSPISADRTLVDLGLDIDYFYSGANYLQVNNGATLTIMPGVTIRFTQQNGGMEITSAAAIKAIGTEDEPIRFVGATFPSTNKGLWRGIAIGTANDNELEYVQILNAGSENYNWSAALYLASGKVDVNNCLIDRSLANGITISSSSGNFNAGEFRSFGNNTVSNSGKAPVHTYSYTSCYALRNMENNNIFEGNTSAEYIHISTSTNTRITGDMTLPALNGYPWYFQGGLELYGGFDFTVEAGATILIGSNQRIMVPQTSHLIAIGTEQAPITIKGFNETAKGYWNGIRVESQTQGTKFDRCNISGGGIGGNAYHMGVISYYRYVEIYNAHISKSLNHGVYCNYASSTTNLQSNAFLKHANVSFSEIDGGNFYIADPAASRGAYNTMPKMTGAGVTPEGWWQHTWEADNSSGGEETDFAIEGTAESGYPATVATVKAVILMNDVENVLVSSAFNSGSFKLNFPDEVNIDELVTISFNIDPTNTKIVTIGTFYCYNSQGNKIGKLEHVDVTKGIVAMYWYANQNVTVNSFGHDEVFGWWKFNFGLQKGWNVVYGFLDDGTLNYASAKPNGANLKWVYTSE